MTWRVATTEDIAKLSKYYMIEYTIDDDMIKALVKNGNCIILCKSSGVMIASALFTLSINKATMELQTNVLGVHGITKEYATNMCMLLNEKFCSVQYSKDCLKYINIEPTSFWNSLEFKTLKEKSKLITVGTAKEYNRISLSELTRHGEGVYSFKLFEDKYCKELLRKTKEYKYRVNTKENIEYRMPEAVLEEVDIGLYLQMCDIYREGIFPIMRDLFFVNDYEISSVQFARYSHKGINSSDWHLDEDSDITAVVTLNNEFEGGGTGFKPDANAEEFEVTKLGIGEVLLFKGSTVMHKGLPVTEGSRDILVFWAMSKGR